MYKTTMGWTSLLLHYPIYTSFHFIQLLKKYMYIKILPSHLL